MKNSNVLKGFIIFLLVSLVISNAMWFISAHEAEKQYQEWKAIQMKNFNDFYWGVCAAVRVKMSQDDYQNLCGSN